MREAAPARYTLATLVFPSYRAMSERRQVTSSSQWARRRSWRRGGRRLGAGSGSAVAEAFAEVVQTLLLARGERVHAGGADLVEQGVELLLVGERTAERRRAASAGDPNATGPSTTVDPPTRRRTAGGTGLLRGLRLLRLAGSGANCRRAGCAGSATRWRDRANGRRRARPPPTRAGRSPGRSHRHP